MLAFSVVGEQGYLYDDNASTECEPCARKGQPANHQFVARFLDEAESYSYMCEGCVKAGLEEARSYYEAYLQALGAFSNLP